ncbi:MAG: signal peptidase I [Bacilli bacterium]|nr:signal peptidase I [Bacilli bacterium]
MYSNGYNYGYSSAAATAAGTGLAALVILYIFEYILIFAWLILYFVGMWKTFVKMGKKGYFALIEGYNDVILLEAAGMPIWNYFMMLIPIYGLVVSIRRGIIIANKFGKSTALGVFLGIPFTAPIAFMILGCSKDAKYKG